MDLSLSAIWHISFTYTLKLQLNKFLIKIISFVLSNKNIFLHKQVSFTLTIILKKLKLTLHVVTQTATGNCLSHTAEGKSSLVVDSVSTESTEHKYVVENFFTHDKRLNV